MKRIIAFENKGYIRLSEESAYLRHTTKTRHEEKRSDVFDTQRGSRNLDKHHIAAENGLANIAEKTSKTVETRVKECTRLSLVHSS